MAIKAKYPNKAKCPTNAKCLTKGNAQTGRNVQIVWNAQRMWNVYIGPKALTKEWRKIMYLQGLESPSKENESPMGEFHNNTS